MSEAPRSRRRLLPRSRTPMSDLWRVAWTSPLFAIPFAAFFLLIGGAPVTYWRQYLLIAACFTLGTRLPLWAWEWFGLPRLPQLREHPMATLLVGLSFALVAILGTLVTASVLSLTLLPGFMGSPRAVLYVLVFALLFASLFLGAGLAFEFHRRALDRAGAERELVLARRIQESFLLSEFPRRPQLDVHAVNLSSRQVSGDFYDVVPLAGDGALLAIADVSGKGVPAALLSSMLQAALRTHATTGRPLAEVMAGINALVCQRDITGQFATFFLAAIHERDLELRYVNAGHNPPVLVRADGTQSPLEVGGLVVGMMEGLPYEEGRVTLRAGDRVVLYTDGVTEAQRADGEMFGEERLAALLSGIPARLSAREQVEQVLTGLRSFLAGVEAQDDVTVMVLRVTAAPQG